MEGGFETRPYLSFNLGSQAEAGERITQNG
jgi:hypothetical protein